MCTVTATASLIGRCPWSFQLIDSMLPCASPETDDGQVSHWICYLIMKSSEIQYRTDAPQHGIYSFYTMIRKRKNDKLALYRLTVRGFLPVKVFSKSKTVRFVSAYSLPFYLTCRQFHPNVFQGVHLFSIGESLFTLFASLTYAYHYLMTLIK